MAEKYEYQGKQVPTKDTFAFKKQECDWVQLNLRLESSGSKECDAHDFTALACNSGGGHVAQLPGSALV